MNVSIKLFLILALLLISSVQALSAQFVLVGTTRQAVIAIPAKPGAAESLAASELAKYVKQISGVGPRVVRIAKPPVGAVVISRSDSASAKRLQLGEEGYSIAVKDKRLYLTGARDRSLLYATYDLLERLGCRWLAPNYNHYKGTAEYVPSKKAVVLELSQPVVEKPKLKLRKLYIEEGRSHDTENLLQLIDWMSKARYNTLVCPIDYQGNGKVKWDNWREALTPELRKRDILIEVGGHGYQNFLNAEMDGGKLFEEHTDWFGVDDTASRSKAFARIFCTSNDAAVDYLVANVLAYLKSHPEIDVFDFWPPDGGRWCNCEACKKLGPPEDRQSRLVGQVIPKVRKENSKIRFECIAYSLYKVAPTNPPMDPSVLIDFCPIGQCFEVQINDPASRQNAGYVEDIQGWQKGFRGDFGIYSYYRKYAWRSLPVMIPHYMQADLRWFKTIGSAGISCYSEPGDWQTYELNHYVLSKLAWNLDANVDSLITDFCKKRFGVSAEQAKALYQVMEDIVRRSCRIPYTSLKKPEELTQQTALLKAARDKLASVAKPGSTAERLVTTADYALLDMALQLQISSGGSLDEREKMVNALADFLVKHQNEGLFLEYKRDVLLTKYEVTK